MNLPWPLHFLKVFGLKRLAGIETPLLAGFKLTHRCNLRCRHCPFWREAGDDMPWSRVEATLRDLRRRGVGLVIFEGGEPLLWRDGSLRFDRVVEAARSLFCSVGVTTNGTLPFDHLAADVIWVSLDGPKEIHDRVRGPSFERAMENIDRARGRNVYANVTVNRENASEIPGLVRDLKGRVRGVTVQLHYPYGRGEEDLTLPPPQRHRLLDELAELKAAGFPVAVSRAGLRALRKNTWKCHDFLIANAEPDGSVHTGCYVKSRGEVNCAACGFAAHTEISLAFDLHIPSLLSGWRIFRYRWF
jgi:MoaA/NifB/PqqE/SkfB family radical SAM enzyme